jgi:hypothetical protein
MKKLLTVFSIFLFTLLLFNVQMAQSAPGITPEFSPFVPKVITKVKALESKVASLDATASTASYIDDGILNVRVARASYSCTVSSDCAVGAHSLGVALPAKSLIRQSWVYNVVKPVSAGAGTVAFSCEDANNILTATNLTSVSSGDVTAGASTGVASTMVKAIAAPCNITATIASADYTTGQWNVFVEYVNHD